jgi:SEC-C motif
MVLPPRPDDPLELLVAPPVGKYALLEFALEWDGLVDAEAQLAAALRLFVITRDPLDWLADRGGVWATSNADGDALELPVYVLRDNVQRRVETSGGDVVTAIGPIGEMVVTAAARCQGVILAGAYPDLAFRGEIPRLLEQRPDPGKLGTPTLSVRSDGWEPMGLGAIQDLVQDAFGPVDLDRSSVALEPADQSQPGCPACAEDRFGFPADLGEAQAAMCETHWVEANAVTASRLERARASNPAGWRAIGKGSARVSESPDPGGNPAPQRRGTPQGRNDPCACGSGRKYKHCCGA